MGYGGAHGGFYETLTSLIYFALLATPLPANNPGAPRAMLCYQEPANPNAFCLTLCSPPAAYLCSPRLPHTQLP